MGRFGLFSVVFHLFLKRFPTNDYEKLALGSQRDDPLRRRRDVPDGRRI